MNKLSTSISALLIGLAGCAIWEFLGSPLVNFLLGHATIFLSNSISSFGNWYASSIASANREFLIITIRTFLVYLLALLILFNFDAKPFKCFLKNLPTALKWGIILFLITDLSIDVHISNESHYQLQNIEIVSPYITDLEYKTMKSDFYSMKSFEEYSDLKEQISIIASENKLHLK